MATIQVSEDIYRRLAERAAGRGMAVQDLIELALEHLLHEKEFGAEPSRVTEDQRIAFDEWMRDVQERAASYPEGFVVDDSRESIYAGREE